MPKNSSSVEQTLFSVTDLCRRWHTSRWTIYRLLESHALESVRLNNRRVFTKNQIEAYERALEAGVGETDESLSI